MSTTGQRQLKTQLRNAYLRGFRAGATGDRSSDVLEGIFQKEWFHYWHRVRESAFARGYEAGKAASTIAENQADRYADTVLASPAVARRTEALGDAEFVEGES